MSDTIIWVGLEIDPAAFDRTEDWRDDPRIDLLHELAVELFRGHDVELTASRRAW